MDAGAAPPLRFNLQPRFSTVPIGGDRFCIVLDGVLADPDAWIEYAAAQRARFVDSDANAYPGPELPLPPAALESLDGYFAQHARRDLGGRRTLRRHGRLSIATRMPAQLLPRQWLCHVDRIDAVPGEMIAASVLYLFHDEALGGTAFYRPRKPPAEIVALVQASARMPVEEFRTWSGLAPGYMTASGDWFERVASVPARFNRLIFYPGSIFHSADIGAPERLSPDPRNGRLTLNGFYVCSRVKSGP